MSFGQQKPDTTNGRFANGTGEFIEMLPTFGTENTDLITAVIAQTMDADLFTLQQNYPNPFSVSTTIKFNLKDTEEVTLTVTNIYGVVVQVLVLKKLPAGAISTAGMHLK